MEIQVLAAIGGVLSYLLGFAVTAALLNLEKSSSYYWSDFEMLGVIIWPLGLPIIALTCFILPIAGIMLHPPLQHAILRKNSKRCKRDSCIFCCCANEDHNRDLPLGGGIHPF